MKHDHPTQPPEKSLIGAYGNYFANLAKKPGTLSFRNAGWENLSDWKTKARAKAAELLSAPGTGKMPVVKLEEKYVYDGLDIEELSWQLPYGKRTKAVFLKPQGSSKPLPAILALHDHAGKKYFGYPKLVKTSDKQHPLIVKHQAAVYSGNAWANDIARHGYAVLVHDTFAFGSRRVFYGDVAGLDYGPLKTQDKTDQNPDEETHILTYNEWSKEHEHVMSKSLFCAGTTWPGVCLAEDQAALSVLSARNDVDNERIGCAGLSGGGVRTVYLAGLDDRIKCAVCVGFMTTFNDLVLNRSYNHTWMTFAPLLANYMDFPEILGLRVPLPTLVQNNNQDALFTLSEMKQADHILKQIFKKAGAAEKYKAGFYDGPHKFDAQMQADAFDWFDKWLA
ncbi:dienelactone hydrolase family protein [Dyadobacter chenhuakuii]|uniref:Acetylxylan esterase n=1 Tax=Dyadobacter chenhuakuii TaxID=2909339 RepID=A0ABY4XID2_9BACT|nr:acetylxylan esterase [Dyadobacter chenhuakuii]MCF2496106.1 acetylxylan esterase [Dyadobacter chenhuakuii]USJ30171.1 acetylxylan esterase [Dyadobacter chenhuakuii]